MVQIMEYLKRLVYHVVRWPRSHGFGVQSPFAYRFVTDVVREAYPYYAYGELAEKYKTDRCSLPFLQFLLRLSNFRQGRYWVSNNLKSVELAYLRAGCRKAELLSSYAKPDGVILDLVALEADEGYDYTFYRRYASLLGPGGVMVIEGIRRNRRCRRFWRQVRADSKAVVTFDIYDCGVVFFDATKPKKNYKLMFSL